jgi:hypothetical protein
MHRFSRARTARFASLLAIAAVAPDGHAETSRQPPAEAPAHNRYARLHTLLQKTFLNVNVLTLDMTVGRETAQKLQELLEGHRYSDELADQAARILVGCEEANTRTVFLRDIGASRFMTGLRDSLDQALRAGFMTREQHREVAEQMPVWFAFLRERGIEEGDVLAYRIRGDVVHTQFHDAQGHVLMDRTDVGAGGRLGLLGGYFAPGAELREGLLKSLF